MSSASPTSPRELGASEVKIHPLFAGQKTLKAGASFGLIAALRLP
jgi:hypothetical protein